MTVPCPAALEWCPYDPRGTRSKIKEFVTHRAVEYELCLEGGRDVIRRTEHHESGQPTIMEAGRGMMRRELLDLWKLIIARDVG
jgi:hypothetical protein